MKVSEAMHANVDWVTHDTPVVEIARIMATDDVGAVPVGKDDRLVGMVTDRDIVLRLVAEKRDPATTMAEQVMTPDIVYCRAAESVEDAIYLMEQKKIRRLPVIDDNKRLVGMLSIGDVSHSMSRELTGELVHAVSGHHP
jgi:CBS domain-containing protein